MAFSPWGVSYQRRDHGRNLVDRPEKRIRPSSSKTYLACVRPWRGRAMPCGPKSLDGYARVYVNDPFGNRIELMEAKSSAASDEE
jgi:hypothetical protein